MLRFLLLVGICQSLPILSNAQQDLVNEQGKYNGPSHQYLPAAVANKKYTLPGTTDFLQQYQGSPQYNVFSQPTKNSQQQATDDPVKNQDYPIYAGSSYNLQQFTELKLNTVPHSTIETSVYQIPGKHSKLPHNPYATTGIPERSHPSTFQQQQALYHEPSWKSSLAFIIPPPTSSAEPFTPPSPSSTFKASHYQEARPHNDPSRKSHLSFILPEITTTEPTLYRDTRNHNGAVKLATDSKRFQDTSQQYLSPSQSLDNSLTPHESIGSTTTTLLPNTSRYQGPNHQYLPVTTEALKKTSSIPNYASKSQNSGSYPNNRPWNSIKTVRSTTTSRTQTGTTPVALHRGYRYNSPAQSFPSNNSQTINGVNYNDLGMGLNLSLKYQQAADLGSNSKTKTEIQTEQGYVYGQAESSSNSESQVITHLNPVPTIPSSYHYYRPGQRFEENPAASNQVKFQTQQGFKESAISLKGAHSAERPSSSSSEAAKNPNPVKKEAKEDNWNRKPMQTREEYDRSLGYNSGASELQKPSPGPAQYQQQLESKLYPNEEASKENKENWNSSMSVQKHLESLLPTNEGSDDYIPAFGTEHDEQQISLGYYHRMSEDQEENTNLNVQQTLQKPVENFRPMTGYPTVHRPSSGPNYSEQQQKPHFHRPIVNSGTNLDLNSQNLESSRPLSGSSAYGFEQYDQETRPFFTPSSPENEYRITQLPQDQQETNGNLRPSDNRPFGSEYHEQQQNEVGTKRYYPIINPCIGSDSFHTGLSASTPSSDDVTQPATPFINQIPYPNLQYSLHHQKSPFQESQGNNFTSKPFSMDTQGLPASNQLAPPPRDSHSRLTILPNTQQNLSHNFQGSNISPTPQEELQKYYTNKEISSLPLGLQPPTFTKPEFHNNFVAVQDNLLANNSNILNVNSLNSNLLPEPRSEYRTYRTSSHETTSTLAKNPLSPNSQEEFPQLLSGFTPLRISAVYTTLKSAKRPEDSYLDRDPSFKGSLVLPINSSVFHVNSGNLNTSQPQIYHTNPLGNFAYQHNQPSQSHSAPSSEIHPPSSHSLLSFNSNKGLKNSKPSLQLNTATQKSRKPQSLAGSPHFSSDFQGYRPIHKEIQNLSNSLPQTEAQKLTSFSNQLVAQNPFRAKQFPQHNDSGTQASYQQQQQLFLGTPPTASQDPGTSSVRNFFDSSASVSYAASNTNDNESNLNPSEAITSPPETVNSLRNSNFLPSHSYPYYIMQPGHSSQGQQSETVKQPPKLKTPTNPVPGVTPSPAEASKPMVLAESPPLASQQILIRPSLSVYGSPLREPSNGYLPPSVVVQPPYLKK